MKSPESYLGNSPNLSTMYFTPTGPREIENIITYIKTKKYGWWRDKYAYLETVVWAM